MKKLLLFAFTIVAVFSFTSCGEEAPIEKSLWIGPERVNCVGIIEQECYQVQEGDVLTNNWEFFYDPIVGFDEQYDTNYIYRIKVKVETINDSPQDASSLNYSLIEIISKEEQ